MKKRRIIKSLYMWMRSYVIVTVVMVAILVGLTTWMVNEFTEEIEKLNHGLTSVLQTSIDTRLGDIDHFTAQLQMNPMNLKMSRLQDSRGLEPAALIHFYKQLYDYKLSNAFIREIYIYYPHSDFVVGDLGYYSSERYYLLKNGLSHNGYQEWLHWVKNEAREGWFFTKLKDGELELCMTKSLPYDLSGDKSAILMVVINKQQVEAILSHAKEGMGSTLAAVVDWEDSVYASSGDDVDFHTLQESLMANGGRPLFKAAGNYGSVMESSDYKIKYVSLIERRQLLNSGYFIRNIAYAAIGLSMIFGMVLFALMGFRNIKPVKEILERLASKSQPGGRVVDDYGLISSELNRMHLRDTESSRKLLRQQEAIESLFLCSLLNSEERNDSVIFSSIQRLGIQMEYSMFQAAILLCPGEGQEGLRKALKTIPNLIKEKKDLSVITTEYGGGLVLLFHMEPEYGIREMRAIAGEMEHSLSDALGGQRFQLLFGGIYDSMSNIILSYHQALMTVEFCKGGQETICFYEEGMAKKREAQAYSGIMAEYGAAMLEERYEEADRLLDLLFNQYIVADKTVYSSRAKKYAAVNAVLEALKAREGCGGACPVEDFTQRLSAAGDTAGLVSLLHGGLRVLIQWQQKRQSAQKENLAERARQYIDLNFKDPMIGLYSISAELGVSNTYLSTTFKKMAGIGIAQYINTKRIEYAKRLILHSDEAIKDIAASVGFSSDAAFIRVFKQFENTTPGRFKKK